MKHRLLIVLAFCAWSVTLPADEYSDEVVPATEGTVVVLDNGGGSFRLTPTSLVDGWTFAGWDDDGDGTVDNTTNPRDVTLTESKLVYDAIFEDHRCTLYSPKYPAPVGDGGTVSASQPDGYCECVWKLTATPASGWAFKEWNDGNTTNPRDVTVNPDEEDKSYTATFVPACVVNTPVIASVTGLGTSSVTVLCEGDCSWQLNVTADDEYTFVRWSDDNTDNPRIVSSNNSGVDTYTPVFVLSCTLHTPLIASVAGLASSSVTSTGNECEWRLSVTANTAECYRFVEWSDHNTDNPRVVNSNASGVDTYIPVFERSTCNYKVTDEETDQGIVRAVLTNECDCEWTLLATPKDGWEFTQWNDGNTDNPRLITMSEDLKEYTATFTDIRCSLYEAKVANPATGGTVTAVNGACECDWTLTATPTEGYAFLQWEDCNYLNPRTVTVDPDAGTKSYTAHFLLSDAFIDSWTATDIVVGTKTQNLTPTDATIRINGVEIDMAHTSQDPNPVTGEVGLWTLPGGLNDYAGQPISIVFYDDATGQPVSVINGTVPYISTGDKSFSSIVPPLPENTDVEVVDGTLTFDDDDPMVLGALTVHPDAKAVVPTGKDVTFTHIYMLGNGPEKTYPQLVANGTIHNLNSDTIYYDYTLNYASYYPLAVPYDVTCAKIRTKSGKAASYEVQWYNGEDRAANAHAWTVFNDQASGATLRAGTGYIVFAVPYKWNGTRHATVAVRFPMVVNLESGEQVKSTHISEYGGEWTSPSNRNWNFIGSPYLANYRHHDDAALLEGTYEPGISTGDNEKYEYTNDGVRYITSSTDGFLTYTQTRVVDQDLVAFNSYFIQAAATGDLTFPLLQRAQNAPRRIRSTDVPQEIAFGIVLSGSNETDYTGLLYGETFTPDYELNADLVKVHGSSPTLALYSLAGTEERAFNALSLDAINQPVPLGYKHATAGLMTFAFDTAHYDASMLEAVMLTDYATGRVVNLLDEHYSFTTAGTEDNARFVINAVLAPRVTTGVDNRTVNSLQPDGVYDLLGRRVSPDMLQQGVYIIIENGQSRKEVIR